MDEPIKIVYLYSSDEICKSCANLLAEFSELAKKHFEEKVIIFGFIDVTRNDNRFIRDEIFPYFLLYVTDNFEDAYGLSAD